VWNGKANPRLNSVSIIKWYTCFLEFFFAPWLRDFPPNDDAILWLVFSSFTSAVHFSIRCLRVLRHTVRLQSGFCGSPSPKSSLTLSPLSLCFNLFSLLWGTGNTWEQDTFILHQCLGDYKPTSPMKKALSASFPSTVLVGMETLELWFPCSSSSQTRLHWRLRTRVTDGAPYTGLLTMAR